MGTLVISDFDYVLTKTGIQVTFDPFVSNPVYCPTVYSMVVAADDSALTAAHLEWITPNLDPAIRTVNF